jgi:methyl-accepting chemotaxis protein
MRWMRWRVGAARAGVGMTVVAAGLVPLVLFGALALYQNRRDVGSRDHQTANEEAATASTQLAQLFDQWRAELLIAANNSVLAQWYTDPAHRTGLRPTVDRLLVQLNALYPDLIDEACFIDARGPELARQVHGVPAAPADLSPDESGNPFFGPTLALAAGQVHRHGAYISPDSGRWVISNSTPLVVNGRPVALLHFEASLEGVRQRLIHLLGPGVRTQVVDVATGKVVIDTQAGPIGHADLVPAAEHRLGGVSATADITVDPANRNRWTVTVAFPPTAAIDRAGALRLGLLALATLIGLVLLARSFNRRLVRPILRMTDIARRLAAGDLSQRIALEREDEVGAMATAINQAVSTLDDTVGEIATEADRLAGCADGLLRLSAQMVTGAEATAARSDVMLAHSGRVNGNVNSVASAARLVQVRVDDVARQAAEASTVANNAVAVTDRMAQTIGRLTVGSVQIGEILDVIAGIAAQTNLLALNATIEAARAGDAGKGFAVVATEVKALAQETAKATGRINATISAIRADTTGAVGAIDEIRDVITAIQGIQGTIADAVRGQYTAAATICAEAHDAACGSDAITGDLAAVTTLASTTTRGAMQTREAAEELAATAGHLHRLVSRFTSRAD